MKAVSGEFRLIYDVIVNRKNVELGFNDLKSLYKIAKDNKVLLELMLRSGNDHLTRIANRKVELIRKRVGRVQEILDGLDYSFFKLVKPVAYIPSDIDVLIRDEDLPKAITRLRNKNFKFLSKDKFTVTLYDNFILDLYTHPSLGGVIFMNGNHLLDNTSIIEYLNMRVPSLKPGVEALIVAAHSVYKERIFTLNDYMTYKSFKDENTISLAVECHCIESLKLFETIANLVKKGFVELPTKVSIFQWMSVWYKKILSDRLARSTSLNLVEGFIDREFGRKVHSKIFRKSY